MAALRTQNRLRLSGFDSRSCDAGAFRTAVSTSNTYMSRPILESPKPFRPADEMTTTLPCEPRPTGSYIRRSVY